MKFLIGLLLVTLSQFAFADEKVDLSKDIKVFTVKAKHFDLLLTYVTSCDIVDLIPHDNQITVRKRKGKIFYKTSELCERQILKFKEEEKILNKKQEEESMKFGITFLLLIFISGIVWAILNRNKFKGVKNDESCT